jgi:hypothetical protein
MSVKVFQVEGMNLKAELTDKQREGLVAEASRCYVGNTLKGTPAINLELN